MAVGMTEHADLPPAAGIEHARLKEARESGVPWRAWGPYLSERQWGTVREDYSDNGNAWDYFSHDQSRSRAYRRGEDGLAGISDDKEKLCFAIALWNGKDPIIKERLFGLTNSEGNHGEDVKECYYYLDSTPTHSYMRYLYKYPQNAYPYDELVETNRWRGRTEAEYELIDTGIFNDDRYFDVFVEYAKVSPDDILIRITANNRGPEAAELHLLPTLWFRNTWSWTSGDERGEVTDPRRPGLHRIDATLGARAVAADHVDLGAWRMSCEGEPDLLFTENETNTKRLFGQPNRTPYVKDGINNYVVNKRREAVNPAGQGTKCAAHYKLSVPPGGEKSVRLRLSAKSQAAPFAADFDTTFDARRREADAFYAAITPQNVTKDEANVMRQAMAGMLWSKQHYYFDINDYLAERGVDPLANNPSALRNREWFHMTNDHVISMPDKWEYPWYAAWDLAFHTNVLATVDPDFAKDQIELMVSERYLHPNGQIPAYEWNFSDVNPPVHAWATLFNYRMEQATRGEGDRAFLERVFGKLMLNFTWWVNRKDRFGKNVFEGGFLGLDNIGVFDRSAPLPTGGCLEQADGTAWMTLFCQNMFEISVELAETNPAYDAIAAKFADHFFWIASALNRVGPEGMWDEEDGFYYDVLRLPDGRATRLKVRSMVGLLPLCAATVIEPYQRDRIPYTLNHVHDRIAKMPHLQGSFHPIGKEHRGHGERTLASLLTRDRLRRVLTHMLDENEFLGDFGIRSLSRYHLDNPYVFMVGRQEYRVAYLPAESDSGLFGGNSNWRGPVWMPVNALIIRSLMQYYAYYGDDFRIECPTGSGNLMNLFEVAQEITNRLAKTFLRDPATGRRAVFGAADKFQNDPHFRDNLLFYEYFHGDNGAGIGASHQTGWTGLVALLISMFRKMKASEVLAGGRRAAYGGSRPSVPVSRDAAAEDRAAGVSRNV